MTYITTSWLRAALAAVLLLLVTGGPGLAAFDVYPSPQTAPLNVAASATSAAVAFTEHVGSGTGPSGFDGMYIRLVMLGPGCAASAAPDPTVAVRAGTGDWVPITGVFQGIWDAPGGSGTNVADARITAEANDVFLVEFAVWATGSSWELRITNNDGGSARDYTWAVADNNNDSRQPWIDVPSALDYDATLGFTLTGQSVPATVQVANLGTGDLTITDSAGTIGTSDFELTAVPGAISPNACGNLEITFNAPADADLSTVTYTIGSDDTTAITGGTHNHQMALSASSGRLEMMMLLDTSGSMAYMPDGSSVVPDPGESRWGRLKASAKQFLDLLSAMGTAQGRFGIAMFPDITTITPACPAAAPSPSAADFVAATDVTPAAIVNAQNSLDGHTPVQNCAATPMGFGIGRVMGTTSTGFGFFQGPDTGSDKPVSFNQRYLVLMSDGAHNSGPPPPSDFYGTAANPTSFKGKKIKALTVAYGDPAITTFEVDHALLTTIATTESDGQAFDAGADDAGLGLKKSFRGAITAGLALDPTTDPGGLLTPGAEVRRRVTITPYDSKAAFVVDWGTIDEDTVDVTLLAPTCEVITPELAESDPQIFYSGQPTYKIFAFGDDYLRNAADPTKPRYGEWTLIIRGIGVASGTREPYDYEVLTKSRLRLHLKTDRSTYYAGDPIRLTARLTLDGKGITDASTTLQLDAPGRAAANWLGFHPVTTKEYQAAAAIVDREDVSAIGIKAQALKSKGLVFDHLGQTRTLRMTDADGQGLYTATVDATSVPGTYELYVTAVGQTEDGIAFRREKRLDVRVLVRPDPKYTLLDVQYRQIVEEGRPFLIADVRVWPRDRFGNVVLVDPAINPSIGIEAEGGELIGELSGNRMDGSYTRSLRYAPGSSPVIGLRVAGKELIARHKLPAVTRLHYADRVLAFTLGHEAEEGANLHRDPQQALGELTAKEPEEFVSLGAAGSLIVGVHKRVIVAQGDDDVTVFVRGDDDLRSYVVEAWTGCKKARWVELGRSPGVTQSFSLGRAGLEFAPAIRIRDVSGRTRDAELQATATPGVSIRGVAFKETRKKCLLERWIRCLLEEKQRHLGDG